MAFQNYLNPYQSHILLLFLIYCTSSYKMGKFKSLLRQVKIVKSLNTWFSWFIYFNCEHLLTESVSLEMLRLKQKQITQIIDLSSFTTYKVFG